MTLMTDISNLETPHDVPITRMLRTVEAGEPDAVGVNCSIDAERMVRAVVELRQATNLPVLAKPQAKISVKCATSQPSETAEHFARHAVRLFEAGAAAVGGCCGAGPDFIRSLRELLDQRAVAHAEVQ